MHHRRPNSSNLIPSSSNLAKDDIDRGSCDTVKTCTSHQSQSVVASSGGYDGLPIESKKSRRKLFTCLVIFFSGLNIIPCFFHLSIFLPRYPLENDVPVSLNDGERKLRHEVEEEMKHIAIEEQFVELTNLWKSRAPHLAKSLKVGYKPSENRPFIFFHQRKAGGSTFRQFLYEAANNLGVRSWIPSCRFGPIPCAVFALPTHAKFAVYGGHFRYMEAHKNFIVTDFRNYLFQSKQQASAKKFTCLITARPTVERVISCWNYRFLQELNLQSKIPHSSNMTASQWDEYLPTAFSKYSEGCNNEFIRNFGDIQDEILINGLKPTGYEKDDLLALRELNNIFDRISGCVVTTLPRCIEGQEAIGYFLPWVQRNANYDCGEKVNAAKSKYKNRQQLEPEAEKAILKHNFIDELIYDFIDTLFNEQLKVAREHKDRKVSFPNNKKSNIKVEANPKLRKIANETNSQEKITETTDEKEIVMPAIKGTDNPHDTSSEGTQEKITETTDEKETVIPAIKGTDNPHDTSSEGTQEHSLNAKTQSETQINENDKQKVTEVE